MSYNAEAKVATVLYGGLSTQI